MAVAATSRTDPAWLRRYPPLAVIVVAISLAAYALPSSLNLPQANPGQVAEYAPVPGNSAAPPGGNFAGLGLGEGGQAEGGGGAGAAGSGGSPLKVPSDCVGNPPRQTEDPLSPPCVPYFTGDNGGATYEGVTRSEVTVVFRMDIATGFVFTGSTQPNASPPPTGYYDMDNSGDVSQFLEFRYLHDWEVYFNHRYQTYKRHVHFWVYNYNAPQTQTTYGDSDAQGEAADNYAKKRPFAVLENQAFDDIGNHPIAYADYMAQHGVLNFGSYEFTLQQAASYPRLFWSYPPSLNSQAQEYASFVCTRIVEPGRVSFSGNGDTGKARRYGLLLTDDPAATVTQQREQLTLGYLKKDCNIQIAATEYFHYADGNSTGPKSGWGTTNVANFRAAGVTTILWPGGAETEDTKAASDAQWYPEWVLEGDAYMDGLTGAAQNSPSEMAHAWVTTSAPLIDNVYGVEKPCLDAILEVDPSISRAQYDISYACTYYYDDIRQLFTGIQLAGPHLTPTSMDQGFHAIPPKPSTSPYTPSCYYLAGDYTCVKDAAAEHYNPSDMPNGTASTSKGCWTMWENGRRYLVGGWPAGDITQGATANDACNHYDPGGATYVHQS